MALTKFTKDMEIIAALDDEPNDVGGLSADELKDKFDEGGKALKEYINDTLIPEVEDQFATQQELDGVVLGQIPDGSLTTEKLADGAVTAEKLAPGAIPDVFTKEETLTEETAALYPDGTLTPNDAFKYLAGFRLLQSYKTAGSYKYTVPEGITEIIGFAIGAGGSGAAIQYYQSGNKHSAAASGGACGHISVSKKSVTSGSSISCVVGKGANKVSATSNSRDGVIGNTGGTSSFDSVTANGGKGGKTKYQSSSSQATAEAGIGLQNSEFYGGNAPNAGTTTPYGGKPVKTELSGTPYTDCSAYEVFAISLLNLLSKGIVCNFAAGGSAYLYVTDDDVVSSYKAQSSVSFSNSGTASSAGKVASTLSGSVTASAGTDIGCGGGAAVASGSTATSAAGHDGAVFIFGR